ncbi:protein tweety homolog 1 [Chelonoidis abingdonii]|uniref:protein tweety homolog 1 n=1 Tax=Chelonoidis abingdonii TaxID=106734 RepID=UPI003F494D56
MGAPQGYQASWWVYLLHQVPRTNFQFEVVESSFAPQDREYQQALLLLASVAGLCLAISLVLICVYLIRFCCCDPEDEDEPKPRRVCCITWSCVAAIVALTRDPALVPPTPPTVPRPLIPDIANLMPSPTAVGGGAELGLSQMLTLVSPPPSPRMTVMSFFVLILSWGSLGLEMAAAVGLSDFCSDPDGFILNLTQAKTELSPEILQYYLTCSQDVPNPFQQRLTMSQRALSSIHSQLHGLEREAIPQFPAAERNLVSVQGTLNSTESNFHQLVALLNCRGLHKGAGSPLASTRLALLGRNQSGSFSGSPRYDSVPLLDRHSPPPSYSPSMQASYVGASQEEPGP